MTWDELPERFRNKVRVAGPDECWEWTAHRGFDGYGIYVPGPERGNARAHRYAFERTIGPIPLDTLCVLHRCDNPSCVNPKHLFLGTRGTNVRDCTRKGRRARGEKNPAAKLQQKQVEMIRSLWVGMEVQQRYLARLYGVTSRVVFDIVHRHKWRHVA